MAGANAHFQLGRDGAAEIQTQCIDIGVDWLGHDRPGKPPVMQSPRSEGRNASGERRQRAGRGVGGGAHGGKFATRRSGDHLGDEIILDGK